MFSKTQSFVSKKLRDSAKGQQCMVRLPGVCNFNPETTILAHIRMKNTGIGLKEDDYKAAFACSSCHDVIDGRVESTFSYEFLRIAHFEAVMRTQEHWVSCGLIVVK